MNKGKSIVVTALLMLLLFAGHASASFKKCYGSCIEDCFAAAGERIACTVKCLAKCVKAEKYDSCKLGCAARQCALFVNDVENVDDCVNKCETGKCKKLSQAMEEGTVSTSAAEEPTTTGDVLPNN